jgi:hypothetical protein
MEIYLVVQHGVSQGGLVRTNVASYTTRKAAEDHIEKEGNSVLPDTGGLSRFVVRPLGLYDNHEEWVEDVLAKAREILKVGL